MEGVISVVAATFFFFFAFFFFFFFLFIFFFFLSRLPMGGAGVRPQGQKVDERDGLKHERDGQTHQHGRRRQSPLVRRARPASAGTGLRQLLSQRGQLARRHRQGPAKGQQ
jgi:hypothetical protein